MKGYFSKVRLSAALLLILSMVTSTGTVSYAQAPYVGYNYSSKGETIPAPVAYKPDRVISGTAAGTGSFNQPKDIFVSQDSQIYIADTGNSRIVVLNERFEYIREVSEFDHSGRTDTFQAPSGIYVTENKDMYVADTENHRVVHLNDAGKLVQIIESPESEILIDNFVFLPLKVAVDKAKRVYVVAQGTFDGIMEFDGDGKFTGFTGTNRVRFNMADYFWKMIATQAQRDRMRLFIPTEYTNLDLDENGFIYTTNSDANTAVPIKRLNPTGIDVLRKEGYWVPSGDLKFLPVGENSGPSLFTDIAVGNSGMYSALDVKRGKIFTYDWDGNLLYIFGKLGEQVGTFQQPSSIDYLGDSILVLDRALNQITVFNETPIGRLINQAVKGHFKGDDELSAELWKRVVEYDANYEIAYIGISKALLRKGLHKEATDYAKLGMDKGNYSKVFKRHRKDVLREHLGSILSLSTAVIAGIIILRTIRRKRRKTYHA